MSLPKDIQSLLENFSSIAHKIEAPQNIHDRPIFSTTIYLATCSLQLVYGTFKAYIFQDIIHKGYIIALAYGDILNSNLLYTRVHSSCVTSETLRGCDCDCIEQLEGALSLIAQKGAGILFYLMQEGRGVGYISKARDRMLVQACQDQISTFEAYNILGLKKDYRQYRNVMPICKMLGITSDFVLLTNNPDKVSILTNEGMRIARVENLEFKPSPYNFSYLKSKMEAGHILQEPTNPALKGIQTPEPVIPFKPFALQNAQRFIKVASYFLPVKPVDSEIILDDSLFDKFFGDHNPIDQFTSPPNQPIISYSLLRKNRYSLKIHKENILKLQQSDPSNPLCSLIHQPYWFRIHLYYDIISQEDFVVLTYGNQEAYDIPIVRIQDESLFKRFPITQNDHRQRYKRALKEIVNYGVGIIIQLYTDGRGAGLGALAEDTMFQENHLSSSSKESYKKLGTRYDVRDHRACMTLLKQHLQGNSIQLILNSPSSLLHQTDYAQALNKSNIDVAKWIFLENHAE